MMLSLRIGAGKEVRTLDLYLGKVSLYQLSYSRIYCIKKMIKQPHRIWSGKRGSNSRPIPWQGIALPAELFPHLLHKKNDQTTTPNLEREKRFELSTYTLARYRSTS